MTTLDLAGRHFIIALLLVIIGAVVIWQVGKRQEKEKARIQGKLQEKLRERIEEIVREEVQKLKIK